MPTTEPDPQVGALDAVHVAVGVVINREKQILVARRHSNQHQGGLWEFPGGKVSRGESTREALIRELREEVNITVRECSGLLKVPHDYGDKQVLLDVMVVTVFSGDPKGLEGQPVKWVSVGDLDSLDFPAANQAIIDAVRNLLDHRNY